MSPADLAGAPYFLVDTLPAVGRFVLDGPEGRHASVVRRLRTGEILVLTDGSGRISPATVTAVGRGTVDLSVGTAVVVPQPAVRVTLVQALPKGERSDLAVGVKTKDDRVGTACGFQKADFFLTALAKQYLACDTV